MTSAKPAKPFRTQGYALAKNGHHSAYDDKEARWHAPPDHSDVQILFNNRPFITMPFSCAETVARALNDAYVAGWNDRPSTVAEGKV